MTRGGAFGKPTHRHSITIMLLLKQPWVFISLSQKEKLQLCNTPHIFPNLGQCDFFLFPKIKFVLKGTHFSDIGSIKMAATTELKKIPENAFQECFKLWKRRMHKHFQVEGITLKKFDFGTFQYFSIKFL